jgi:hypothetical protein
MYAYIDTTKKLVSYGVEGVFVFSPPFVGARALLLNLTGAN